MDLLLVAVALLVGGLLAVQAAANLQLSSAIGNPVGASALQLGIATALLVVLAAVAGTFAAVRLLPDAQPWHLLGGLGSALYITAGILLFPGWGRWPASDCSLPGRCWPRSPSTPWASSGCTASALIRPPPSGPSPWWAAWP